MNIFTSKILNFDNDFRALTGAGIGLKPQHYQEILDARPDVGWFEVHAENYMGEGGAPHHFLTQINTDYPLSIHGVGLSIGGADPLDTAHLKRLQILNDRYKPSLFSEHLAWSSDGGQFLNDLLPLPYNNETLEQVCDHISQFQDVLGRQILLENPSVYIAYAENLYSEPDFLARITDKTGCGLLLDVNNIYVSAQNNSFSPTAFIESFPLSDVKEIHLAGHAIEKVVTSVGKEHRLLIDDHGCLVCDEVWALYTFVLGKIGAVPTLIERDNNIPSLTELVGEARTALEVMKKAEIVHAS